MKPVVFLLAALIVAVSLASFAGSAKAAPCQGTCSNLANMRHEMLKAIANNLRG